MELCVGSYLKEVIVSKSLPLTDILVRLIAAFVTPSMIIRLVQTEAILVAIVVVRLPWIPIYVSKRRAFLRRQPRTLHGDVRCTQPHALYMKMNQTKPFSYHNVVLSIFA